jgi:subtilisin family serine protease
LTTPQRLISPGEGCPLCAGLDGLDGLAHGKGMPLIQFSDWTKLLDTARSNSAASLLLGAALAVGCEHSDDLDHIDLINGSSDEQDLADTGGAELERGTPASVAAREGLERYIVMMKHGADPRAAAAAVGATPDHLYTQVISGFAAALDRGQLEALGRRHDVELIEADEPVYAADPGCSSGCPAAVTQQKVNGVPAYSIDRIDQSDLPYSNSYTYTCSGEGVNVYVFDTWMDLKHQDFGGRASLGYDGFPNSPSNGGSCSGHGTHVAGIIGGTSYGVAKHTKLINIKVLDCSGSGMRSRLLAGMDWVKANKGNVPAVANMSLSGSRSLMVNSAIDSLAASGVTVVVAAGNSNDNACRYSPAGASSAVTTAASNSNDQRASFSNYGPCVDVYAGGTNVRSAWPGDGSQTATGTSMASPAVAGVAALYKQAFGDATWAEVKSYIQTWASPDKIAGNPGNTVNLLLYWPCSGSGM